MDTISDLKKSIKVGMTIKSVRHDVFSHRDSEGNAYYKDGEEETTTVAEVKSIQFAVWRIRNGEKVKSWMHFPRRAAVKFNGDSFTIMDLYFNRPMITYTLVRDE